MTLPVCNRHRVAQTAILFLVLVQCSFAAVSKDQIIVGLRRSVPSEVIERIVRSQGIAFTMDDQIADELRSRGAEQSLIQTLREMSNNPTPTRAHENVLPKPPVSDTLTTRSGSDEKSVLAKVPAPSAAQRPPVEYIDWWSQLKPHLSWKALNQTTPSTYEYGSRSLFAAKFWLSGPKDVLSKIGRVEYYFDHPSYHPPNKIGRNSSDGFTISYKAWGCIENVRITIIPRDSNFRARHGYSTDFPFCEEVFTLPN
jgi:hypothetical protein